jgi:hypothetical protein
VEKVRAYPGEETPVTPDEPDALDGGGGAPGFTSFAIAVSRWKSRKENLSCFPRVISIDEGGNS